MPSTVPEILHCDVPAELPVIGIKSTVVFPFAVGSVQLALPEHLALLDAHPGADAIVAAAPLVDPEKPLGRGNFGRVAVACRILQRLRLPDGTIRIALQGLRRVRLEEFLSDAPFLRARVACPPEESDSPEAAAAEVERALRAAQTLASLDPRYPEEIVRVLRLNREDPSRFADLVPTVVPFPYQDRRALVETLDTGARLSLVARFLEREAARARLARELETKTAGALSKSEREVYLREQLVVIRRELGEEDSLAGEADALDARIAAIPLSAEAREEASRETRRLRTLSPGSPEATSVRHVLDWILALPWGKATGDAIHPARVRAVLDRHHHGLDKAKERIVELLSVRKLTGGSRGFALCFVGAPGTGKTSLARSIAEALGRRFARISLGGVHDEAEIRGHRRTYVGSMPGRILQAVRRAGTRNPVLVLDEIDKLGEGSQGNPAAALLEVLDPEQNAGFVDHFLGVPFDLSAVLFVTTANAEHEIPPALLDRMEVIPIPGYTDGEKVVIARSHLLPRVLEAHGLRERELRVTDGALRAIVREYAREAGIRHLRQSLDAIARKVAVRVAERRGVRATVGRNALARYLGPPVFLEDEASGAAEVGVATGLAWTPDGGALLVIEALRMPGTGRIAITGSLGEVLRESVEAAFSFVRARAVELGIDPEAFASSDLHVHFPAGAIPKDGPSAGAAVATALASLFADKPVRAGIGMTGEVTLRGRLLPVGGVKEKVLAADRAGLTDVVLPRRNAPDLGEVPREVRSRVRFHLVSRMDEVLDLALSDVVVPRRPIRQLVRDPVKVTTRRSARGG